MPEPVLIVGAGPAGLSAARFLTEQGCAVMVCEQHASVGGVARTEVHQGYRIDVGGHRFLTKVPEVQRLWEETLRDDFTVVTRQSRILYDRRFFDYPLDLVNLFRTLEVRELASLAGSYAKTRLTRSAQDDTLERWMIHRFGRRLYETFFRTYTEKIWGTPCSEISVDWAAQRIRGVSLPVAVVEAVGGRNGAGSLAREFHYPRLGAGQMWDRFAEIIDASGSRILLGTRVTKLYHDGHKVRAVDVDNGNVDAVSVSHVVSSMPIGRLVEQLEPAAPDSVLEAASRLRHRAFIMVALVLDSADVCPDHWLYIHDSQVRVGRIQNFNNWSADLVPEPDRTSLGLEYFCSVGDAVWSLSDAELVDLASRELRALGLGSDSRIERGFVVRQGDAYPVYHRDYATSLATIRSWLEGFENLQTIGRNGLHRYNNQDHSVLTGLLAARQVLGERHDVWTVNMERSYLE